MKLSPVAGPAQVAVNPNEGHSASAERVARAKAAITGQAPPATEPAQTGDRQVDRVQGMKRLKMRTQMSQDRHKRVEEVLAATATPAEPVAAADPAVVDPAAATPNATESAPVSDALASSEPAQATSEETKPLSPQFAALAKQKRALQLKEQQIAEREKALETSGANPKALEDYRARVKSNALQVLLEEGVTYDQLTEQILASNAGTADLSALRAELKAEIASEFENQQKTQADRDAATEKQVLANIRKEADQLVAQGDDFEMIREAGYAPKVVDLIHRTFKETGELLDTTEAARLIENKLLEQSLKFARIKKVQSQLTPAQAQQQAALVQQDRPGTKTMRTLTNRDGVSSTSMSKRERAIAAMEGRLTK